MKLEELVKFLEDIVGLPATVTNCDWVERHPYNKWCDFKTPTGIEVIHFELQSNDGYDWRLNFNISQNWDLFYLIFGEEENRKNTDLVCKCGCYSNFHGDPVDLFGNPVERLPRVK